MRRQNTGPESLSLFSVLSNLGLLFSLETLYPWYFLRQAYAYTTKQFRNASEELNKLEVAIFH